MSRNLTNQKENYKEQIEYFKTDVANSLQEHINQIEDTMAEVTLLDREVQDLHEKTVINIGIKNEFEKLKTEVVNEFQNQAEIISEIKESANEMIDERNQNKTEVHQLAFEVKELKMWKQEITLHQEEKFNDEEIKIEDNSEAEEESQEEELIEDNYESESELQEEPEDPTIQVDAKQHNQDLRIRWYRYSIDFIPDKFKLQYVQANANRRNQETIFEWYKECVKIDLIPDEFQLIPEDTEIEKATVDQPGKKKSFHKRRKEENQQRKLHLLSKIRVKRKKNISSRMQRQAYHPSDSCSSL